MPNGTATTTRGRIMKLLQTFLIKCRSNASVILKSAITPSLSGRTAII